MQVVKLNIYYQTFTKIRELMIFFVRYGKDDVCVCVYVCVYVAAEYSL